MRNVRLNATAIAMISGGSTLTNWRATRTLAAGMPAGSYGGAQSAARRRQTLPRRRKSHADGGSVRNFGVTGSAADESIQTSNKAWSPDGEADGAGVRTTTVAIWMACRISRRSKARWSECFSDNNAPTVGAAPT